MSTVMQKVLVIAAFRGFSGSKRLSCRESKSQPKQMASRSALSRLSLTATRSMQSTRGATRYFSDDKGRVLSEEERAAENVYIKVSPPLSLLDGSTDPVWLL
ncbi:hypothetical protein OIU77_012924 [Salix suchowensis]|uniref:Uncharacterized protein n=1 Tax=Salix suchowensis TaxID=1278906 RepID=A0ABQ9A5I2_9ROSI|nr:hypothetical protein OIU77_012924 [Salix suchowensis]